MGRCESDSTSTVTCSSRFQLAADEPYMPVLRLLLPGERSSLARDNSRLVWSLPNERNGSIAWALTAMDMHPSTMTTLSTLRQPTRIEPGGGLLWGRHVTVLGSCLKGGRKPTPERSLLLEVSAP